MFTIASSLIMKGEETYIINYNVFATGEDEGSEQCQFGSKACTGPVI